MARFLGFLYGVVCYAFFLVVFLYAIGFVGGLIGPRGIDGATGLQVLPPLIADRLGGAARAPGGLVGPLLIDMALLGVFALQHSVMARPGFKAVWTRIVPRPVERSTYVLLSSLALALVCWRWRPLTATVWQVEAPWARTLLWGVFWLGWATVLSSTFLIDHFELFGLRQVADLATGKAAPPPRFRTPLLYRLVRHPLYFGFLMAFWAAPTMSLGRLVFSLGASGYIVIGAMLEERDLVGVFGQTYRDYQQRVSMLIPLGLRRRARPGVGEVQP